MKPRTNILLRSQAYQLYFIEEPVDQLAFLLVMAHHSKKKKTVKIYKNNIQSIQQRKCALQDIALMALSN